ncbi:unnamed protein product [Microthlaspi erraticum]|uniref:Uncharacterized protein n=1 Tax=Microthlaspi erraticum TaxID=1685480 RepID=A0A6D2IYM7_9BRAS|nr:unnamed protein product [Microthlaspi erraticum]
MASSSTILFHFDDGFEQAMDDEFESCMEECLVDINEVLEPEKRRKKRAVMIEDVKKETSACSMIISHIPDGTGKMGLTGLQKCTAAIRMLAYGNAADASMNTSD